MFRVAVRQVPAAVRDGQRLRGGERATRADVQHGPQTAAEHASGAVGTREFPQGLCRPPRDQQDGGRVFCREQGGARVLVLGQGGAVVGGELPTGQDDSQQCGGGDVHPDAHHRRADVWRDAGDRAGRGPATRGLHGTQSGRIIVPY